MKKKTNAEIADILREMAGYLELSGVAFKPRAFERAADIVENLSDELYDMYREGGTKAMADLDGIGEGIAGRIEELFVTGHIKEYEALKKKLPVNLGELIAIEGLGVKKVKALYDHLGVKTLADLKKAVATGKVAGIAGFGKKTEENIKKGIAFLEQNGGRCLISEARAIAERIAGVIRKLPETEEVVVVGSIRRFKETVGDIDILVVSKKPERVMETFVGLSDVVHVYAHGDTKSSVRLRQGLDADIRVIPRESFGAAMNYFTGSKAHNIALRELAIKHGWKLSEYGLFDGDKQIAGETEKDLYEKLGLAYVEPEMREDTGEIELAAKNKLPKLIGYGDLKGDLQVQTNWTDGAHSILEMADAAARAGLEYIAITDHTKRLAMARGLDEKRIREQWKEIEEVNKKLKGKIVVLRGSECDILKDGSLDLPDDVLALLDVVGISVHSLFNLSREEQTERIIKAMENPNADILFHPTGRLINRRKSYDVDMDTVIAAAKKTGTVLEINAFPDRLDLKDEHIKKCVAAAVPMVIDSDAHAMSHFSVLEYGIAQARRAGAEKGNILNALPLEKFLKCLKK